jgi:phosphoenolpyruvate carboxykinase (GTP)
MPATTNQKLLPWVEEWAEILQPDAIEWCDGSEEELLTVDVDWWASELLAIAEHFNQFGDRLPHGLLDELRTLDERLID